MLVVLVEVYVWENEGLEGMLRKVCCDFNVIYLLKFELVWVGICVSVCSGLILVYWMIINV